MGEFNYNRLDEDKDGNNPTDGDGDMKNAEMETNPVSSSDDLDPKYDTATSDVPKPELRKLALDWVELEGALENNSPELHSFLNIATGDVIRIFRGNEDVERRLREVETDPDYLYIEPISSREQYRWMEEFIEQTEESAMKDKLNIAVDGKGAFRRFKDVLVGYPEGREKWFAMRSGKLRIHIIEWLNAKGIEAINIPPWDHRNSPAEGEPASDDKSDTTSTAQASAKETMTDLRQTSHDLVDLIPSRELPTAVAFLEFLRSRRGVRRSRYS